MRYVLLVVPSLYITRNSSLYPSELVVGRFHIYCHATCKIWSLIMRSIKNTSIRLFRIQRWKYFSCIETFPIFIDSFHILFHYPKFHKQRIQILNRLLTPVEHLTHWASSVPINSSLRGQSFLVNFWALALLFHKHIYTYIRITALLAWEKVTNFRFYVYILFIECAIGK